MRKIVSREGRKKDPWRPDDGSVLNAGKCRQPPPLPFSVWDRFAGGLARTTFLERKLPAEHMEAFTQKHPHFMENPVIVWVFVGCVFVYVLYGFYLRSYI